MSAEFRNDEHRPPRHLRVGLTMTGRAVRVTSVWLVDEPPVQRHAFAQPIVVSVKVAGHPLHLEALADPRVARSTMKPGAGHHYERTGKGILNVSVPFAAAADLDDVTIRVADLTGHRVAERSAAALAALLEHPDKGMRAIHELSSTDLRASADWHGVAQALGLDAAKAKFEIYLDKRRRYRWRLLRSEREIIADSGEGYASREACLADLNWMRAHAPSALVDTVEGPGTVT